MRSFSWILLAILGGGSAGAQNLWTPRVEPANLYDVEQKLISYHDCREADCYDAEIDRQIDRAMDFLKTAVAGAKPGEKLALVLDVDETALSNWAVELKDNLAYVAADWNACVAAHCGTAIAGTLRLYKQAEKDGVTVFFITGRPETQRADTEANLKAVGYERWKHVSLRPVNHAKEQTVTEYKSGERAKIVAGGYRIVLNVGDQLSDLEGSPMAETSVKLPNPFYFIP